MNFGEPASVQCTILGGDNPLTIMWEMNGEPIPGELGVTITRITKHIHVLAIEAVNADHSGNYSCIAKNAAGLTKYTTELIVNGLFFFFVVNVTKGLVVDFSLVFLSFLSPLNHYSLHFLVLIGSLQIRKI